MTDLDEWEVDRLDLDAYLDRIVHRGGGEPTREPLSALHRAHVREIPFENLDIILGRGIGAAVTATSTGCCWAPNSRCRCPTTRSAPWSRGSPVDRESTASRDDIDDPLHP